MPLYWHHIKTHIDILHMHFFDSDIKIRNLILLTFIWSNPEPIINNS